MKFTLGYVNLIPTYHFTNDWSETQSGEGPEPQARNSLVVSETEEASRMEAVKSV